MNQTRKQTNTMKKTTQTKRKQNKPNQKSKTQRKKKTSHTKRHRMQGGPKVFSMRCQDLRVVSKSPNSMYHWHRRLCLWLRESIEKCVFFSFLFFFFGGGVWVGGVRLACFPVFVCFLQRGEDDVPGFSAFLLKVTQKKLCK